MLRSELVMKHRRNASHWLRRKGYDRNPGLRDDSFLHRLADIIVLRWNDWPSFLMIITGMCFGGNWSEPTMKTWFYRIRSGEKKHWLTGYPKPSILIVKDYDTYREMTKDLDEDGMYEWGAFNNNQDGDLHLGKRYWGGTFYDLESCMVPYLTRYLLNWHFRNWFGLRTQIYHLGLKCKVHRKHWYTCNEVPPPGGGGYNHWHCEELRWRHGPYHRFRSYRWDENGASFNVEDERVG